MIFRSYRWRIAVPYVVLILITMTGLGVFLSNNLRKIRFAELENQLSMDTQIVRDVTSDVFLVEDKGLALDSLAKQWADNLGGRVTIIGADGIVVGESLEDRTQMENHINRPEIIQAINGEKGSSIRYSQTVGYDMMYSALSVKDGEEIVGFVRVAIPVEEIETELTQLRQSIFAATFFAAGLAVVFAALIAERTSLPLRRLTESVKRVAIGDTQEQIIHSTQDEIGQLTQSFNNITTHLQTEFDNLNTERTKLTAVLNQMTDGVMVVDDLGQNQLLNQAAERIFKVKAPDVLGQTLVNVVRHHQLVELWRQCQESGEEQVSLFEIGQDQLFLQVFAVPLGQSLSGWILMVIQDLTQVRHLEQVRSDFISNISHELSTPLASLKALTDTLQEFALDDPPAARRFLFRMGHEVDALTQMVQELLELSRIESGRVPLQLQAFPPLNLLVSVVDRMRLQADRSNLTIQVIGVRALPEILADPPRIEQVLVNLLHNAIKFTPPGGTIDLWAQEQDGDVLFTVVDTGIGIPSKDLPRIFEHFYKSDRAGSGGAGLGLTIARHLVEAHGGRIWAESVETQGSRFYFTIPKVTGESE
jgi:two-component system phosphate regulon sensor histidine kinase PhoR